MRHLYDVTRLLAIAGIPRASYYKWRATEPTRSKKQARDQEMKEHMMTIHFAHPYFGYPRMVTALGEAGYLVNHKKVWRLMKDLAIQSVIRKKRKQSNYTEATEKGAILIL